MDIALINAVPFLLALLLAAKPLMQIIPKAGRAWLVFAVMALLFFGLLSYWPQLQSIDQLYKEPTRIEAALENPPRGLTEAQLVEREARLQAELAEAEANAPADNAIIRELQWVPELGLALTFYLDGLSMLFALVITGIGAVIFLYAGFYFEDGDEQLRFLMIFSAFAGAMLGVVLAGNLLTMFVMWELTSITSFLLIGFKGAKSAEARFASMQALLITNAGALALLIGLVLLGVASSDTLNLAQAFTFELTDILHADPQDLAGHVLYPASLVMIMIGAFTKSAQFPFHFWLPGAMSAPTPASAYLHSATMVKAGIYLLLRLHPPMHDSELWSVGIVAVGCTTMFIGALFALTKRDLKGLLAYATVSKLGAIVLLIGLPGEAGIEAALIGILAHALYKSALFLVAGTIDHNTGTRVIEKLGGLREFMPIETGVAIISGLSMAGFPFLLGFLAKEELIHAALDFGIFNPITFVVVSASALTVTAAFIYIWDVFFAPPLEVIHYHQSSRWLHYAPAVMAVMTVALGLGAGVVVAPLITPATHEPSLSLPVLPQLNQAFLFSVGAIITGYAIFVARRFWLLHIHRLQLPTGTEIYQGLLDVADWLGSQALRLQSGQVRYYLVIILGTLAVGLLGAGQIGDFIASLQIIQPRLSLTDFDGTDLLRLLLLLGMVVSALYSVLVRRHTTAALILGAFGYSVGALFLLEPAPDVSLVQFLVETLATVLIIIMLGRISTKQRREAQARLWLGRSMVRNINLGIIRDVLIAGAVGFAVFIFAATAVASRPDRNTIADYHLQNAEAQTGVEDIVGAIVTDYRGMDTYIEISVFAVAALGVLTLLARGYERTSPFSPADAVVQGEFEEDVLEELKDFKKMDTPFIALVTRYVLPLSFLVGLSHIINGSHAPGDGFTAGVLMGLATALWYVVFGYEEAEKRLPWFNPSRLMRAGLLVSMANGVLTLLLGAEFAGHVDYDALLGIKDFLAPFELKLNSTLVFEIGIFLTVFGGVGMITETIAHPIRSGILLGEDDKSA